MKLEDQRQKKLLKDARKKKSQMKGKVKINTRLKNVKKT